MTEVMRMLKPGGLYRYVLVEHVAAKGMELISVNENFIVLYLNLDLPR